MLFNYVCKDDAFTAAMKRSCEDKLTKFDHYFRSSNQIKCVVTITDLANKNKSVEVSMSSPDGVYLRAKTSNPDFYDAIDVIAEKLTGQMRKVKTRVNKTKKKNSVSENFLLEQIENDAVNEDLDIVNKKKLSLAPMDVDEALDRMDALGHSFFIFLDSATGLVNVLYEREDHGYGVIEIDK